MRFSRVGWMVAVFVVVGALLAPAAFARGGIELKPPVAPPVPAVDDPPTEGEKELLILEEATAGELKLAQEDFDKDFEKVKQEESGKADKIEERRLVLQDKLNGRIVDIEDRAAGKRREILAKNAEKLGKIELEIQKADIERDGDIAKAKEKRDKDIANARKSLNKPEEAGKLEARIAVLNAKFNEDVARSNKQFADRRLKLLKRAERQTK